MELIVQNYGQYSDLELDNLIKYSNQLCAEANYYEKVRSDDVIIPMEYLLEKIGYSKTVAVSFYINICKFTYVLLLTQLRPQI